LVKQFHIQPIKTVEEDLKEALGASEPEQDLQMA